MSFFRSLTLMSLLLVSASPVFGKVEAVKGKRYQLTKQHGPWMIMAAALRDVPPERRIKGGMTAWEAADQLVYELRRAGIPAYAYVQRMKVQEVRGFNSTADNLGDGKYIAQHEAIAVLAGNFSTPDDKLGQRILHYLKNDFEPAFLGDKKSGAVFARTPGRPRPLSRAHMARNPLLSAEDANSRTVDKLTRQLNADMEYSLLKNKGKYTVRIATFRGSSILQVGNREREESQSGFNKIFGNNLDAAGTQAWELTEALRAASKLGYDRDFEAYVFHDKYQSVVTIGSFDTLQDPRIPQLVKQFGGKARVYRGQEVLTGEVFTIPRNVPAGQQPEKSWIFDTDPRVMDVPKLTP